MVVVWHTLLNSTIIVYAIPAVLSKTVFQSNITEVCGKFYRIMELTFQQKDPRALTNYM